MPLKEIKLDENIGGPIELQVLAELNNLRISLSAYSNSNIFGEPEYYGEFKKINAKNPAQYLKLILINATTKKARIIIKRDNETIDPESCLRYDNIYAACVTALISKPVDMIKQEVIKYIEKNIKTASCNPLRANNSNDIISKYFDDYIYKGYKGNGKELKEFDLLPIPIEWRNDANSLRVMRKKTFKVANAVLAGFSHSLAKEMDEWMTPYESLKIERNNFWQWFPVNGYDKLPPAATLLTLCNFCISTTNAIISENFPLADKQTYEILQSFALISNILVSIIYCLDHHEKEKNRAAAVRSTQEELILNLPLNKMGKTLITLHPVEVNAININANNTNNTFLRDKWINKGFAKLSFTINGKLVEITKSEHLSLGSKVRDNYTSPVIAASMLIYIGLAGATFDNVAKQYESGSSAEAEETMPDSVTSPHTANALLAMLAAVNLITMISSESYFEGCLNRCYSNLDKCCPKHACEHELNMALTEISNIYAYNYGAMPNNLANLFKYFKADSIKADALTKTPHMVNIQKSIFNAREELKMHIKDLEQNNNLTNPEETQLLNALKAITEKVDFLEMEKIYLGASTFTEIIGSMQKSSSEAGMMLKNNQATAFGGKTNILFSARNSLRRLSGVLKLMVATTASVSEKEGDKKSCKPSFSG